MYLNKAMVIGNLTKDPELKSLPSGSKVCSFSVATNRTWKDAQGAKQEEVEYHNIVAFGKTAELIAQWMSKGSQICVEGRLSTRSWDDKESGKKMYRTEVVVESMQFGSKPGGNKKKSDDRSGSDDDGYDQYAKVPSETIDEDDIPL